MKNVNEVNDILEDSLFNTLSKCESIREDIATLMSPTNLTFESSQIIYTSGMSFKYFNILKSHFTLLFPVKYPNSFFHNVYINKYMTLLGLEAFTKELTSFAIIDIKNTNADILALGVFKEYQNKKIGSKLLNKVLEELITFGVKQVRLFVQASNYKAIRLYKNAGFVEIETCENYYKGLECSKAIIMVKNLVVQRFWLFSVLKNFTKKLCF
jgi:ribosomal protein S18 acetylase RimI-like enzyme